MPPPVIEYRTGVTRGISASPTSLPSTSRRPVPPNPPAPVNENATSWEPGVRRTADSPRRRSRPQDVDQLRQLRGRRRRQVVALGEVGGNVVQLPGVVVERRIGIGPVVVHPPQRLERHRLPTAVVHAAATEHLEVLGGVAL